MKYLSTILIILSVFALFSCSIESMFEQPTVEITGYTLKGLPADTAFLDIDMTVLNNDHRQVHVADVDYSIVLEDITLPDQTAIINQDMYPDSSMDLTLPLSMLTSDAVKILAKLDAGEELDYSVTGLFHVDDPIFNLFDLPLNVSGTATVDAGYEDFYNMPIVTVGDISGNFTANGADSYIFDFEVSCLVENMDSRGVTIDEVEYIVYIEGIPSETHLYSESYSTALVIAGDGSDSLTLPIMLTLDATSGAQLASAIDDGSIDYIVEGIFHATEVDSIESDFTLPMYITGNMTADIFSTLFVQPTVEIVGYTLKELPGDTTYLEIDMLLTNNDTRTALIADVEYQVVIEDITALEEHVDIDQSIGATPLELTLPLTLLTADAVQILAKLDAGEELAYKATGTFHIDDPVLEAFNLPIDIEGIASVEVGYEEFYEQPNIELLNIKGDFTEDTQGNYVFNFDVTCMIQNMDTRSVTLDEIEYVVNIEGLPSETQLYSDSYSNPFTIAASGSDSLSLPVVLTLDETTGAQLAQAIKDGTIDYSVEGIISIIEVNGSAFEFALPIYITGNTSADIFAALFEQPTIEVTGYELLDLPGDTTFMNITMLLTNNDTRTAHIYDADYQVVVDGISALPEYVIVDQTIPIDTITLTMPLTLLTADAIQMLTKLDEGESLDYVVTGTFHIDDPVLEEFDLPIDISGTATIDVGFEDFYDQPEVTVIAIDGTYRINGFTSYTLNFDVDCSVQNLDSREATIDEVEYTVTIEGVKSNKHYYSNTYSTNFVIAGSATEALTLPVTFNIGISAGAALVAAVADGSADYIVEGTFHVILVDGTAADFTLPLYIEGSVPATMVSG
ncbi:MAG: LEA type 2 family protein [Candidatus Marinimicrobia bacterium]|nr:LEA type 2 family protein [Candidatus Neomarinimicrobiota bacterium]